MDVVELAYRELYWEERISESINRITPKKKVKRGSNKSVGFGYYVIGYITGISIGYIMSILVYDNIDLIQDIIDSFFNLLLF